VAETPEVAGSVVPPPVIFLVGFISGAVINFFLPTPIWPGIWVRILGALVLALGLGFGAWAFRTFARHKTPPGPWAATVALVQDGPYGFSRNPIYLSFALEYLGFSFIFNSVPSLILFVPVVIVADRKQILREERYLEGKFKEEYRIYKSKVRRWI
jgi:protein-S-isoprenylcysteine O-methyltransferase Ste14